MAEMYVSASDFRVHLKDLANQVARGGDPVVMSRHGFDMVVMISWEDYQRWSREKPRERDKVPDAHPDHMDAAEVERTYEKLKTSDDPVVQRWCSKALLSLWVRKRHQAPEPAS